VNDNAETQRQHGLLARGVTMSDTYMTAEIREWLDVERDIAVSPPISENDIRKWAIAVYWPETPPKLYWDADHAK
jgi:hypothetical protein